MDGHFFSFCLKHIVIANKSGNNVHNFVYIAVIQKCVANSFKLPLVPSHDRELVRPTVSINITMSLVLTTIEIDGTDYPVYLSTNCVLHICTLNYFLFFLVAKMNDANCSKLDIHMPLNINR